MPGEYAPSWLAWEAASGGRATLKGSVAEMRAMNEQMMQALLPMMPPFPENVNVEEKTVDGVPVRIYTPKNASGPLPVAIWTHGGGYALGDLNFDHLIGAVVAEQTNSAVINVDYRLAPETKWPGQLDDAMKVYRWAHSNASSFGGDQTKFYTIGGSAGGALAFQIANQVVVDSELKSSLKGICAMVPFVAHWDNVPEQYKAKYKAVYENALDTPILDAQQSMKIFFEAVGATPNDSTMFTILSENKKLFPPTYMTSCEFDPLRDDAAIMEEALKEAGVPVKHDYYPGFPHYFWIIPAIPEGQTFNANLLAGIKWLQSQM